MGYKKKPKTTTLTDHIMDDTLISFSDANYTSPDFNYYYDGTMNAFDAFYKKYNLILMLCNKTYKDFPDGSLHKFDFYNMEHSLGINSFGQDDQDANDLLEHMLSNITINPPDNNKLIEFNKKKQVLNKIIENWKTNHILEKEHYKVINEVIKEFKDIDNRSIQSYLVVIAKILAKYSIENKTKLVKYKPSKENRHKKIINDLVHFIDVIDNPQIKSILFNNNNFEKLKEKENNGKDNFDEKSLVLGYFTNYLATKYDINPDEKGLGIDVGKLIEEAKEQYLKFYAEEAISDTMKNDPKAIIKKLKKTLLDETGKNNLNKIINTIINNETINNKINHMNINYYLSLTDKKDLTIYNMILLKNISKNIPNLLEETNIELEDQNIKLLELEEEKERLEEELKNLYYKDLSEKEFKNIINAKIRTNKEGNSKLEKNLIETTRIYKNLKTKINNIKLYEESLLVLEEKTKDYKKLISKKLIKQLEEYIDGKKIKQQEEYLNEIITSLLLDNYLIPVKNESRNLYNYSNSKNISAKYLPESIDKIRTKDLELKTNNKYISNIFKDVIGYSVDENDLDNSLKLLAEASDKFALNIAYDLYNKGFSTEEIVEEFKLHPKQLGIVHLTHSLMKNEGVKKYLKNQFDTKTGISFNYDKIMYKCNSMLSIDELIYSKVKTVMTAKKVNIKGITLTEEEKQIVNDKTKSIPCKYIMLLGGESDTRTLVYLTEEVTKIKDAKGKITYKTLMKPLHSIRRTKENGLSAMFTKKEYLDPKTIKYMPDRRNDDLENGIELEPSKPRNIIIKGGKLK